jgi:hypothetical protein
VDQSDDPALPPLLQAREEPKPPRLEPPLSDHRLDCHEDEEEPEQIIQ